MAYTNAKTIYDKVGAEAVLTEQPDLRQYLTGFGSTFGYVLSDKKRFGLLYRPALYRGRNGGA